MSDSPYAAPRKTNDSPIARRRIALGLTQAQLAELIGVSNYAVNRWETTEILPQRKNLEKLAAVLGCQPRDLIVF